MLSDDDKQWLAQQFERLTEALTTQHSRVERNRDHWKNLATGNIPSALFELGLSLGALIERVEKLENR
jgi:hypothetical protein